MRSISDVLLFGSFPLSAWEYVKYVLIMTHITIATVTIYYHRALAHSALYLHPALALFFRFWGCLTTGMIPKEWVMIHRYHHAKDDGLDDPHSPWVYGIWYTLFFGVVLYYRAACNRNILRKKNCEDIKPDWFDKHVFNRPEKYGRFYGVGLMLIIDLALFGLVGALIWIIQMLWIPFWAAGVINGLGHWPFFKWLIGYRNTETKDHSANIIPWGVFIGGEELHNNHHMRPQSAKLSLKWYEFDIGWLYIRLLEMLGLAKVKYTMTK